LATPMLRSLILVFGGGAVAVLLALRETRRDLTVTLATIAKSSLARFHKLVLATETAPVAKQSSHGWKAVGKAVQAAVRLQAVCAHSPLESLLLDVARRRSDKGEVELNVDGALAFYSEHIKQIACSKLPIECFVNYVLLVMGARRVIQFDLCFYSGDVRNAVTAFIMEHCSGDGDNDEGSVHAEMMQIEKDCNVVLYLEADHEGVERKIEEVGGVGSKGYAKLLDEKFYASQFDVAEVYRLDCSLKQVAFNVATANASKKGALLVQMLSPAELDQKLRAVLQQRFEQYAQLINRIDSTLVCSFDETDR